MRRRWVQIDGELVEVSPDFVTAPREARNTNPLAGDRNYDGLQATDGTNISSRTKHRQYMKDKGVTVADDFKGEWAKARSKREEFFTTGKDDSRRGDVDRAFHDVFDKRR